MAFSREIADQHAVIYLFIIIFDLLPQTWSALELVRSAAQVTMEMSRSTWQTAFMILKTKDLLRSYLDKHKSCLSHHDSYVIYLYCIVTLLLFSYRLRVRSTEIAFVIFEDSQKLMCLDG